MSRALPDRYGRVYPTIKYVMYHYHHSLPFVRRLAPSPHEATALGDVLEPLQFRNINRRDAEDSGR
jgi:hypothetical protein